MKVRCLLIALALIIFLGISRAEFKLGMDKNLNFRYWMMAFPAAISHLYHDMEWSFASYSGIQEFIMDNASDPDVLKNAIHHQNFDRTISSFLYDDKGYVELTRLAFILFGVGASSILKFYIFVFGCSLVLYLFAHWRSTWALLLLNFILLGVYSAVFAFPACSELEEVTNPRALGMLSLIALCHLLVLIFKNESCTFVSAWFLAILQGLIVALVYFSRSPELWQFLLPFACAAIVFLRRPIKNSGAFVVLSALMFCFGTLLIYQYKTLKHPYYDIDGISHSRVRWHNVGLGFALNPQLAEKYEMDINNEATMYRLVSNKTKNLGIRDLIFKNEQDISIYNWVEYDRIAKSVVFDIIKDDFFEILMLHFFYKPKVYMNTLISAARHDVNEPFFISETDRIKINAFYNPFSLFSVICLFFLIPVTCFISYIDLAKISGVIGLVWMGSLIPGFLTYPTHYIIGFGFATSASVIYLVLTVLAFFAIRGFLKVKWKRWQNDILHSR